MYGENLETDKGRGLLLYLNKEINGNEVEMESLFEGTLFVQIKHYNN